MTEEPKVGHLPFPLHALTHLSSTLSSGPQSGPCGFRDGEVAARSDERRLFLHESKSDSGCLSFGVCVGRSNANIQLCVLAVLS